MTSSLGRITEHGLNLGPRDEVHYQSKYIAWFLNRVVLVDQPASPRVFSVLHLLPTVFWGLQSLHSSPRRSLSVFDSPALLAVYIYNTCHALNAHNNTTLHTLHALIKNELYLYTHELFLHQISICQQTFITVLYLCLSFIQVHIVLRKITKTWAFYEI